MKEVPVNKSEQEIYNLIIKNFFSFLKLTRTSKVLYTCTNFYFKNLISSFTDKKLVRGN